MPREALIEVADHTTTPHTSLRLTLGPVFHVKHLALNGACDYRGAPRTAQVDHSLDPPQYDPPSHTDESLMSVERVAGELNHSSS